MSRLISYSPQSWKNGLKEKLSPGVQWHNVPRSPELGAPVWAAPRAAPMGYMHLLTVVGLGLLQVHRQGGFPGLLAASLSHSSCRNPGQHHWPARHGSAVTASVVLEGRAGPQSESHLGEIFVLAAVARHMQQVGATLEGPAVVGKLGRVGPQGIGAMGCFVLTKVRENERNGISPHQLAMWKESKRKRWLHCFHLQRKFRQIPVPLHKPWN